MVRIKANNEIRKLFGDFTEDFEICDDSGRVLARVQRSTPWTDPDQWERLTPEITAEELKRRRTSNEPRYTTQEVIEYLNNLN